MHYWRSAFLNNTKDDSFLIWTEFFVIDFVCNWYKLKMLHTIHSNKKWQDNNLNDKFRRNWQLRELLVALVSTDIVNHHYIYTVFF